ncbi:MAG: TerD family protein [Azoarcus sp.]|jgi:tellurium resistance protein TerZ|nr:TerD family protein [Azoarcus sp.]
MAINLQKGQKISLEKEAGTSLSSVVMGLGWDAVKKKGFFGLFSSAEIDLDASCLMFDENKNLLDVVWFRQLKSRDGSIIHTGDNRTGDGEGDDEQIIVALNQVPANVKSLIFTVNSFTGQNFSQVENAFCRLCDQSTGKEIARYELSVQGNHSAQIMAKVYRHDNEWKMHAIGENGAGRTFNDLMPQILPHV